MQHAFPLLSGSIRPGHKKNWIRPASMQRKRIYMERHRNEEGHEWNPRDMGTVQGSLRTSMERSQFDALSAQQNKNAQTREMGNKRITLEIRRTRPLLWTRRQPHDEDRIIRRMSSRKHPKTRIPPRPSDIRRSKKSGSPVWTNERSNRRPKRKETPIWNSRIPKGHHN